MNLSLRTATPAIEPLDEFEKRTQVDGRCECDTEITNEEKEKGTQVMRCKARGCETGWVRTSIDQSTHVEECSDR